MKLAQRTQRRRPQRTGPGISLFPFLAVLICTMGTLVPLLLAITRTARLQAEDAAVAKLSRQGGEIQIQREDSQWRIEQLKKSRTLIETQLADARLELGHLEDHSRRLRGTLARYQKTATDLESFESADSRRLAQSQAELEQIRSQIGEARQQLAQTHQSAGCTRSYAVVPFEGPNQTHRRPIYLECREDSVVLQPEGITLTESDFEGPLGPGNPLAAALRATREQMLARGGFDPQAGEPYPLLLVRPDGINAYYAARAAMKSWGFDFGYELVEGDWKLAYPPPDARLAEVVRQAVASARASQARLIAAAPRQYNRRPKAVYRVSPTSGGGIVRDGSSSDDDGGYVAAGHAGPVGGTRGGRRGARGEGATGSAFAPAGGDGGGAAGNPYLAVTGGQGGGEGPQTSSSGTPRDRSPGEYSNSSPGTFGDNSTGALGSGNFGVEAAERPGTLVTERPGTAVPGSVAATGAGVHSVASAAGTERPEGYIVGQPSRDPPTRPALNEPPVGGQRGYALRPGEWQPTPEPPRKPYDKKDKDDNDKFDGKQKKRPPDKRGADWGLREVARGSTGITRPIRVECHADRLVVVSERGPTANRVISLGPRTASSIDPLISAVWEQMETWGMAGRRMYWRPLLQCHVAPGADDRFIELASVLQGSGLMVERK